MHLCDRFMSISAMRGVLDRERPEGWLTPAELERWRGFRSPRRALQWLGGRWLAKQILAVTATVVSVAPRDLHVESQDGQNRAVRPRVFFRGRLQPWSVSISHSDDAFFVAATTQAGVRVGVDVMPLKPLARQFTDFWFTTRERQWCLRHADPLAPCLVWSVKEAYYKASNEGEPFAPRRLDVMTGTPLTAWNDRDSAGPAPGSRWVFEDERCTLVVQRTGREIATLASMTV